MKTNLLELLLHDDDRDESVLLSPATSPCPHESREPQTPFLALEFADKEWEMSSSSSSSSSSSDKGIDKSMLAIHVSADDNSQLVLDPLSPLDEEEIAIYIDNQSPSDYSTESAAIESNTENSVELVGVESSEITPVTAIYTAALPSPPSNHRLKTAYTGIVSPEEVYRLKNRERMRRVRRRQSENIKEMRKTLAILEQHYQRLASEIQQQQASDNVFVTTQNYETRNLKKLEADYITLANLSHHIQEEKFQLERLIAKKEIFYLRVKDEMAEILTSDLTTNDLTDTEAPYSDFEFTPLTQAEADERIHQCYEQMLRFESNSGPHPACNFSENPDSKANTMPLSPSTTFGWTVSLQITRSTPMFVCCSKFFAGIMPEDAMQRLWLRNSCSRVKFLSTRPLVHYETLQVINESAYVAGVDQKHPVREDLLMRSIDLRFRLATEKGFVMGRCSVNPTSPELRKLAEEQCSFDYLDSSFWIEFTSKMDETTGAEGCFIKFYVHGGYNTTERLYVRLLNVLSIAFLWENSILPSPLKLLPD